MMTFAASLLADEGGVTGGQIAAVIALSNVFTGAMVGLGAWLLSWRKARAEIEEKRQQQSQGFKKEDREQDRLDRDSAVKEWERLVTLYGQRIAALEQNDRDKDVRLTQVEEAERDCQKRLRRYWRIIKDNGLKTGDSDEYNPLSPVPQPPGGKP